VVATSHIALPQTGGIATKKKRKKKLKYMCFATLDSLNETESKFLSFISTANISSSVYTFRGVYYNAFSKTNSQSTAFYIGVLVSTQCTVNGTILQFTSIFGLLLELN